MLEIHARLSNFQMPRGGGAGSSAQSVDSGGGSGGGGSGGVGSGSDGGGGSAEMLEQGVLAVGIDVTSLVGRAAAASQEVHDLKRLIDCANAPIFGINATALITEWNRKATQITGRSKWEVSR